MFLSATAESGTNGALITTGAEWDGYSSGGGATCTYSNAITINDTQIYKSLTGSTAAGGYAIWSSLITSTGSEFWTRSYINIPTAPSGNMSLIQFRYSSGLASKIIINSSSQFRLQDGSGADLGFSTNTFTAGSTFRIEMHYIASASPTGGTFEFKYFASPNSTTATETMSYTNMQTAAGLDAFWVGISTGGTTGFIVYHDDDALTDVGGWIGPSASPATAMTLSWMGM